MEKQEVLDLFKQDSKEGDEREKQIISHAHEIAYYCVEAVFIVLAFVASFQKTYFGTAFTDWEAFALAVTVGGIGENVVNYIYYKRRKYIFWILVNIAGSIASLFLLIVK